MTTSTKTSAVETAARIGSRVVLVCGRFLPPRLGLLAGGIGAGLRCSAAADSCAMGQMLSKMPWNRSTNEPAAHQALQNLDAGA